MTAMNRTASDGVGLQFHALGNHADPADVATNIERFRDLGLAVHITEMDVAFPIDEIPADPDAEQANYYREIIEVCLDTGVEMLVTWGVDDGHSWLRSFSDFDDRFTGDPLLFDENYRPKSAYDAVRDALIAK